MKIGIITTTIREGRAALDVANWVLEQSKARSNEFKYEIVDLKDFDLPAMGLAPTEKQAIDINNWTEKINELDGYIFVTAEYNHAPTGVIKNALDYLNPQFTNKPVGFVGYGGVGGARAVEHLRLIFAEYGAATIKRNVHFLLAFDFENFATFKPMPYHETVIPELFDQLESWTKLFKTIR